MFELQTGTDRAPGPGPRSPRERLLEARESALAGLRRVAAGFAAQASPRCLTPLPSPGAAGPGAGATPLLELADRMGQDYGQGGTGAVLLAAATILEAVKALDSGVRPEPLGEGLEAAARRARELLAAAARPASASELARVVERSLRGAGPTPPRVVLESPHPARALVVPWSGDALVHRSLKGHLALLSPQVMFVAPPAGSREGPVRLALLRGPGLDEAQVEGFMAALAGPVPAVVLVERMADRVATRVTGAALKGATGTTVLGLAAPEAGPSELSALGRALGLPVFGAADALVRAGADAFRALAAIHYLGRYALLEPGDGSGAEHSVFFCHGAEGLKRRVEAACRVLEATRDRGVVPGGGAALAAVARGLGATPAEAVLARALEAPLRITFGNEGMDPDAVLDRLRGLPPGSGYDLVARRWFGPADRDVPVTPTALVERALTAAVATARAWLADGPLAPAGGTHA